MRSRLLLLAGPAVLLLVTASAAAAPPQYNCLGTQTTLFDNTNADLITDTGSPPSFSTGGKTYCMTYIQTYHYNEGNGAPPGTLGINRVGGSVAGAANSARFAAKGTAGQGGANENWYADVPLTPNPTILDGSYTCYDSDPSTWSADSASQGDGFCIVKVVPAIPVASTSTTPTTNPAGPPAQSSGSGGGGTSWWVWLLAALGATGIGVGTYAVVKKKQDGRDIFDEIMKVASDSMPDYGPPVPSGPPIDELDTPSGEKFVTGDSSGDPDETM
jgi:hypothetical protein